jgi:hypothetical protein
VLDEFKKIFVDLAARGQIIAAARAFNGRVASPDLGEADAIITQLEHEDGTAITVSVPYVLNENGSPSYGEPRTSRKEKEWFV